jgi:hypothetical protein
MARNRKEGEGGGGVLMMREIVDAQADSSNVQPNDHVTSWVGTVRTRRVIPNVCEGGLLVL